MTLKSVLNSFAVVCGLLIFGSLANAQTLPNPVLYITHTEPARISGKTFIRYHFDVFNKDRYPPDFFAASPELPPCGSNTKSARTWVEVLDQSGKRLNSFCAFGKPADLSKIWITIAEGEIPPSWVYIEMTDRKTNTKYKSNLAETTQ